MGNYRFIISGGGTGGHIYPAIAIANELKKRHSNAEFLFVGAKDKMEMEKVPKAGYEIKGLWISGLQRKLTIKNLLFPIKLIQSLLKARGIIRRFKPDVAIGTGGFASGPTLKAAASSKIPYILQEQNSFAGITNKLLAKNAAKICVAYDGMERFFPKGKLVKTGNPVRADLVKLNVTRETASEHFKLNPNQKTLLILGGSLGARRINQLVAEKLDFFEQLNVQLIWQCGRLYFDEYKGFESETVKVLAFINKMNFAFTAADIIISRAGAGSVSELCLVGKPTIFIPSPNVAEDHQTKNAEALVEKNAAILLKESTIDSDFETIFKTLLDSPDQQKELANNIKQLGKPKATEEIVDEIEKLLK
ncbi:undecaprenyldiphospho-muramoylpentapeptide beta-N-acetylglucosaminyltransferase [Croceivirga thetidis]|uniref:UDP-N-acetylglucosamine--N-acetylmuramyl-(pentapeptide) pyrophosphoryl-undecaprenol N-acetylglucosamine transferase n=1 Tax=Croceivirga thetidis TaxID=2721623 RepID=A0ABX1GNP2_9FLAO|nr:undecaprenyldiphospho-muramoylpentapeptide beta-N-acetylglucosaminyltransferase [Croceivirga thetidis]